jgi:hypothetical protein
MDVMQATTAPWPLARIGIDGSCYTADDTGLAVDMHGWHSDHPIFTEVFQKHRPKLVCEIGTWKGASVLHMHGLAKSLGLDTHFICIDTWLGSNDTLWVEDDLRPHLQLEHGFPNMFRQFVFNVKVAGAQDHISPFPITSTAASRVFHRLGIKLDALYIDAGHEEEEVYFDIKLFYGSVIEGGAIFGDDYHERWPGVIRAVNRFCAEKNLELKAGDGKYYFVKRTTPRNLLQSVLYHSGVAARGAFRRVRPVLFGR